MKIYNTLTRKKEDFIPLEENKVKMYVCGPTVYNDIHIGNARPMIVFDTVRRYFEYKGYDVNFVSNFTDVDDKIIKKANEEGVDAGEISERYIESVKEDMKNLNVKPATTHPKATEEIDGMIEMISTLVEKGNAYEKNGTVYFRTRSFPEYGKLSKKNIDDLEAGHREIKVAGEEDKEDPLDFVLWKPKKEGEPYWESPWSKGRPGWHIECSVMSKKYLGEQIDIHAGGEDLIFPHHENEIAQSEAANGKEFAKYWMHNGYLNIDNKKMSKSEGNFFTVKDIAKEYPYEVLRFFMLSGSHYRMPLNFSRTLMESAKNSLERIKTAVSNLSYLMGEAKTGMKAEGTGSGALGEVGAERESSGASAVPEIKKVSTDEKEFLHSMEELRQKFEASMEDDFNTADAIAAVVEMVKLCNSVLSSSNEKSVIASAYETIVKLCGVLGIETEEKDDSLDREVEALIELRQKARKEKDFAKADEIREQLLKMGIELKDTREGVKWKKISQN